jgi:hypothetical protein
MSASRYPTLSMTISVLEDVKDTLENTEGGLDMLRRIFLRQLEEKFGDYMADEELSVATSVDPRYKLLYFTDTAKKEQVTDWVLTAMEKPLDLLPIPSTSNSSSSDVLERVPSVAVPAVPNASRPMLSKLERLKAMEYPEGGSSQSSAYNNRTRDSLRHEFSTYVSEPTITSCDDPLKWWRENQVRFPNVALVARRLLGVPATSVASERAFSKAGDVITKKRNRLEPTKAELVLFLMEGQ